MVAKNKAINQDVIVLVVEDDRLARDFIGASLERRGYSVVEATGHAEARRAVEVVTPHVLLADLTLQTGSGADLAAELCRRLANLRTILMSGYREQHVRDIGWIGPDDCFISKPFRIADLCQVIDALVAQCAEAA